jgi:DNA-directed RNA polymerase specialized sigma24 family protein
MSRATGEATEESATSADARSALLQLSPERRLAVILVDVLGMTLKDTAKITCVEVAIVRERVRTARAWLASQRHATGMDEVAG